MTCPWDCYIVFGEDMVEKVGNGADPEVGNKFFTARPETDAHLPAPSGPLNTKGFPKNGMGCR